MSNTSDKQRDKHGRFAPGNKLSVGHTGAGGRPANEIRAMLREAGEEALPRIRAIADDPKHKDHYKALTWLAERGLREEIENRAQEGHAQRLELPSWGAGSSVIKTDEGWRDGSEAMLELPSDSETKN